MGAGKGKRVMGGGGPMSQSAQQAELKLEQMVDQRDMAVANASVNGGDPAVEQVTHQEILPISEVLQLCSTCASPPHGKHDKRRPAVLATAAGCAEIV